MTFSASVLRSALAIVLTAGAACAPARMAQSIVPNAAQGQSGFYRMTLGDFKITAVLDGVVPLKLNDLLTHTQPGQVDHQLAYAYLKDPVETSVNVYVVDTGAKLLLVDTGAGALFGATCGRLIENLRAAGYAPEQIDEVLITHAHSDHIGGLMTGGKPTFPRAVVRISKVDADFWLSPVNLQSAPADSKKYFLAAVATVGAIAKAGNLETFEGNVDLAPGVRAIASPGHTPGHTFYALESKGQRLVFWGDMMHVAAVQFPSPEVTVAFDIDPSLAAVTREKAYAEIVKQGDWVAVSHISFPGIGHVRAEGKAYGWVPINYSLSGTGQ